ncbi:NfeD family protein [Actinospongicola halichondriae]|uniref:NfeD family protein n=1 Tax=Actinospongicola halichondriae TaxID=3236844 RepID=UPI003D3E927F
MTTLFVVLAIAGVGMLLIGFVLDDFLEGVLEGAFDALDVDGGGLLSVPVVGAFLGAFGIGGLLVDNATEGAVVASFAGASVGGVVLGFVALKLSRSFMDMPTDATLTSGDYMGQSGRVITAIAGGRGEVMVHVGGSPQKLTAHADVDIDHGDPVVVIEVLSSSSVRVIPLSEILEDPSP